MMRLADLRSRFENYISALGPLKRLYLPFAVLFLYLLLVPSLLVERSFQKERKMFRMKLVEFSLLSQEYDSLKGQIDVIEGRLPVGGVGGGIAGALEDVASSLGLREKVKSVKVLGSRGITETLTEETAEVQVERLNMNEFVQMIYRLREAQTPVLLKRATAKKVFENPDLLDLSITVALYSKK